MFRMFAAKSEQKPNEKTKRRTHIEERELSLECLTRFRKQKQQEFHLFSDLIQ